MRHETQFITQRDWTDSALPPELITQTQYPPHQIKRCTAREFAEQVLSILPTTPLSEMQQRSLTELLERFPIAPREALCAITAHWNPEDRVARHTTTESLNSGEFLLKTGADPVLHFVDLHYPNPQIAVYGLPTEKEVQPGDLTLLERHFATLIECFITELLAGPLYAAYFATRET